MTIYLFLFCMIIVFAISLFYRGTSNIKKKAFLFLSFTLMFIIMGFRDYTVGTDTKLYCNIFYNYSQYDSIKSVLLADNTPIYGIYNKLLSLIWNDWRVVIICNSLIILLLTAIFIYNNSKNIVLSTIYFMTFYHFFNAFNISRQYISVMIIANSIIFLKNKKTRAYLFTCIIATLIHNTAIVSLFLLPLSKITLDKYNIKKILKVVLIIIIACILFLDILIKYFIMLFPHYKLYFESTVANFYNAGQGRKIIITYIYILLFIVSQKIIKEHNLKNDDEQNFLILHIINFIAIIIGFASLQSILIARIECYFSIFVIIFIPNILYYLNKYKDLYILSSIYILFIPMYIQLSSNMAGVLKYTSWIFEK